MSIEALRRNVEHSKKHGYEFAIGLKTAEVEAALEEFATKLGAARAAEEASMGVAKALGESVSKLEKEREGLKLALAFWIAVAFTNGAEVPDDLVEWSQEMLAGGSQTAVEATREALGLSEDESEVAPCE